METLQALCPSRTRPFAWTRGSLSTRFWKRPRNNCADFAIRLSTHCRTDTSSGSRSICLPVRIESGEGTGTVGQMMQDEEVYDDQKELIMAVLRGTACTASIPFRNPVHISPAAPAHRRAHSLHRSGTRPSRTGRTNPPADRRSRYRPRKQARPRAGR